MMAGDAFSGSLRICINNAYTSHAMEETPQPLWMPPKLCRREVREVLTQRGTHDLPIIETLNQNSTRKNASLRQRHNMNMLPIENRAGLFLA